MDRGQRADRAWLEVRADQVDRDSGLGTFLRARAGRCIRREPSPQVRVELRAGLRDDLDLLRAEHVRDLGRGLDLARDPADRVGRAHRAACFRGRARLRVELRDRRRDLGNGAADSVTKRAKKAR